MTSILPRPPTPPRPLTRPLPPSLSLFSTGSPYAAITVDEADISIKIKKGFITVFHTHLNLCDYYQCPVAEGPVSISLPESIPSAVPKVSRERLGGPGSPKILSLSLLTLTLPALAARAGKVWFRNRHHHPLLHGLRGLRGRRVPGGVSEKPDLTLKRVLHFLRDDGNEDVAEDHCDEEAYCALELEVPPP